MAPVLSSDDAQAILGTSSTDQNNVSNFTPPNTPVKKVKEGGRFESSDEVSTKEDVADVSGDKVKVSGQHGEQDIYATNLNLPSSPEIDSQGDRNMQHGSMQSTEPEQGPGALLPGKDKKDGKEESDGVLVSAVRAHATEASPASNPKAAATPVPRVHAAAEPPTHSMPADDMQHITKTESSVTSDQNQAGGEAAARWPPGRGRAGSSRGSDVSAAVASEAQLHEEQLQTEAPVAPPAERRPADASKPMTPECDLYKGEWLPDTTRPLYNGSTCQWLAPNWACRKTVRPNYDYEYFRWQPRDCSLPRFNATDFLRRMQNKVVAFVGDSLGQQQFQSLLCLLSEHHKDDPVEDVGPTFGFVTSPELKRPSGWAYNFTRFNATVALAWTSCMCDIQPYNASEPTAGQAFHLDRPHPFLQQHADKLHVVVLNTGHHWNRNKKELYKWDFHVNGTLANLTARPRGGRGGGVFELALAKETTVRSVVRWLDDRARGRPDGGEGQPMVLLRTMSPRHFMDGEWDSGGRCDNIKVSLNAKDLAKRSSRDLVSEEAVAGTSVHLMNVTYLSDFRGEAHLSRWDYWKRANVQDCLHWCLPGIPDTWNEILYARIILSQM
eukprot:jgi/Mesen1/936/ME000118S00116